MLQNQVINQIKNLLYEDVDKTSIRELIFAWKPGLTKKEFERCYAEAFFSL